MQYPRPHLIVIGCSIAAASLAVGFGWGRVTAPARVEVKTVEKQVEVQRDQQQTTGTTATSATASAASEQHVVTRWLRRPDGTTVVTRRADAEAQSQRDSQATSVRVEWRDRDRIVTKEVEVTKVVEGPRPRWHIMAKGGVQWTGERLWGGGISYRVLGPFTAGIDVTNRAGMLVLGVTF